MTKRSITRFNDVVVEVEITDEGLINLYQLEPEYVVLFEQEAEDGE